MGGVYTHRERGLNGLGEEGGGEEGEGEGEGEWGGEGQGSGR